jgi:hypothetical protein
MHGGYGNKVDIFGRCDPRYARGYEPFTAKTDEELVANKEARVEFTEADWVRHFDGSARYGHEK